GTAWSLLGLCEFETKDYANSLLALEKGQKLGTQDPDVARVATYHLALLLNRDGQFERASTTLIAGFGHNQLPAQVKTALGLALLRVPLFPDEIDPSKDALVQATGEVAAQTDTTKNLDALAALIAQYPQIPYLHYAYGVELASAGQWKQALAQQQTEVRLSPQSALPQIQISTLQLRLHQPEQALHAAQQAVTLAPQSPAAHHALADALRALGKIQKSQQQLALAQTLPPEKSVRETRILQLYAASPAMSAAASNTASPDSSEAAEISRKASAFEASGNIAAAVQLYQQELQTYPAWDAGRWSLNMLYYSTENYAQAIPALQRWVEQKPNDGTAWAVLGLCEFATNDTSNAFIHLERGQQLGLHGDPQEVQLATYHLAILLNQKGQFDRAKDLLAPVASSGALAEQVQIALGMSLLRIPKLPNQAEPSQLPLLQRSGTIVVLMQNSKYDAAYQQFQELLLQYPAQPYLHYAYGMELAALSRYDEATAEMHRASQLLPDSELPYIWLALIALRQHQPAAALSPAQRAVQLAPNSAEAHYMLGRAYLESGQTQAAIPELEAASSRMPDSPEVHFALAKAYTKANMPEKAAQERAIFAHLRAIADARHK
ncbi:MAG TPA: tetratricopeptide repeat protein, partial [Acidobacteriaceae bacterium]|nr:tetratricopeptide repeat protein [Acidobacteriaceae bacterium]